MSCGLHLKISIRGFYRIELYFQRRLFSIFLSVGQCVYSIISIMETLTEQKLVKALKDNKTYKGVEPYLEEIKKGNKKMSDLISTVITQSFTSEKAPLMTKLLALRLFKDIFLLGNMEFVDSLDPEIEETIVTAASFNPKFKSKGKNDKKTRGQAYFVEKEQRPKETATFQLGNSFVLLATQIIKYFAKWYPSSYGKVSESSRFLEAYELLQALGVPCNTQIYFTAEQQSNFHRNHAEWLQNQKKNKQIKAIEDPKNKEQQPQNMKIEENPNVQPLKLNDSQIQHKIDESVQKQNMEKVNGQINDIEMQKQLELLKINIENVKKESQQKNQQIIKEYQQKINQVSQISKQKQNQNKVLQNQIEKIRENLTLKDQKIKQIDGQKQVLQKKVDSLLSSDQNQSIQLHNQYEKYKLQSKNQLEKSQLLRKQAIMKIQNLQKLIRQITMEKKQIESNLDKQKNQSAKLQSKVEQMKRQIQQKRKQEDRPETMPKDENKNAENDQIVKYYQDRVKKLQQNQEYNEQKVEKLEKQCKKWEQLYIQEKQRNKQNNGIEKNNFQLKNCKFYSKVDNSSYQIAPEIQKMEEDKNFKEKYALKSSNNTYFQHMSQTNSFQRASHSNSSKPQNKFGYSSHSNSFSKVQKPKNGNQKDKMANTGFGNTVSSFRRTQMSLLKKTTPKAFFQQKAPHSIFPFIYEYFPENELTNSEHFRACCISESARSKPFFMDETLQIFLMRTDRKQYCLKIKNRTNETLVIKLESETAGIKYKSISTPSKIMPFSESVHRISADIKDLNFRYPMIYCLVQERRNQIVYRLPVPLTLASFVTFDQSLRSLSQWEQSQDKNDVRRYRCEKFKVGQISSIMNDLNFQTFGLGLEATSMMGYPMIEGVNMLVKVIETQGFCEIETEFDKESKLNEAFSKVILQALMFSLI